MDKYLHLIIFLPAFSAILILLFHKLHKHYYKMTALITSLVLLVLSVKLFIAMAISGIQHVQLPLSISIPLVLDPLSSLMLLIVNTVAFAVLVYSWSYIEHYTTQWKYFSLYMLLLCGMNGVILSGDLFNIYIFLEIASIASYALVSFGCHKEEFEASFKYMLLGSMASIFLIFGIALVYGASSTLNISAAAAMLSVNHGWLIKFITALLIAGFAIKSAIVPFHSWLPDAHTAAPAPISATLSGILIKVLGIYMITRITFTMIGLTSQLSMILLILGSLSMLIGAVLALYQWDFKRLLAYSSISQIGFMVIGIALGTPLGLVGAFLHLFSHAIFKSLLFLSAGAVEQSTGTREIKQMGGLKEVMPITAFSSMIGSLSISGIPPFNGFWSKLIIIIACIQAGKLWVAMIAVVTSIITIAYILKVQRHAFFGEMNSKLKDVKDAPLPMSAAMLFLSALSLSIFAFLLPAVNSSYHEFILKLIKDCLNISAGFINTLPKI